MQSVLPLFERYPILEKKLPRIDLGTYPTPVQRLERFSGDQLWIKRDDLSSTHFGGNKVRKFEFLLADAKLKRKKHIITVGGLGTNHGLAAAIFGQMTQFKCSLILFDQPITDLVKQNLRLFHKFNARIFLSGSMFSALVSYFLLKRLTHPCAYFIYPGGSNVIGAMGYVNAAMELKGQIEAGLIPEPEVIFCPLGSGGTQAGLMVGVWLAGLKTKVVGVRVTYAKLGYIPICNEKIVAELAAKIFKFLQKHLTDLPLNPLPKAYVLDEYVGEGYGFPTAAGAAASAVLKERADIFIDACYTAKTFAAVLDYCRAPSNGKGPVLFWHTHNTIDLSNLAQSVAPSVFSSKVRAILSQDEITTVDIVKA